MDHTAGRGFTSRGIRAGDVVFIVTIGRGGLHLIGAMEVAFCGSRRQAARALAVDPRTLWKDGEHLVAARCTPMDFDLVVPNTIVERLKLGPGRKPPKFRSGNALDGQTLRGVRVLARESAEELLALLPPLSEYRPVSAEIERPPLDHRGLRALFARISWMAWYNGEHGDEPESHMSYVAARSGPVWERFNFAPLGRRVLGYVAPTSGRPYRLSRIEEGVGDVDELNGVLLVFVASRPNKAGQVVVGWYDDATLYDTWRETVHGEEVVGRADWGYCCECDAQDAVLLPTMARTWLVPRGTGGMGQAKVRYYDPNEYWMRAIIDKIRRYDGPSLLSNPRAESEDAAALGAEISARGSQGFCLDGNTRRVLEEHALQLAIKTYEREGYAVTVAGRPYDLFCQLASDPEVKLWVEVKGTQGRGEEVILTRGEVEFYSSVSPHADLFLVHSIKVRAGRALGGTAIRYTRWSPDHEGLVPISYWCKLPPRG